MRTPDNPLSAFHLRVLGTLLEERSVTRAARRLGLSQPAASLVLKQLRDMFGDPLLVRSQGGMVLTERAAMLQAASAKALEELDGLLVDPDHFDPSSSRQTFTIALPDHILPLMFNGIMREFRRRAPMARLVMRALGPDYDFEGALASGSADLVISNWPTPPSYLRRSVLFEDEFVCLVDRDHEFTRRPPSADEYLAASHVAPADYAIAHRGVVETHLSAIRVVRERRVVISYFSMAPYLLVGTDLIFTVTRHFAEHFAGILPLAIIPSPIAYPRIQFYQLWHERMQHSPTHRWLRMLIGEMRSHSLRQR
ncbi:LysR family transcriptional regulator [Ancylobacter sp. Lp-2]|uniref:LysR family transcriptional regulator n=1 Tax=Ancylobacter sp. Lp-2 TaxID=2881339 RepID=UPI001E5F496C|nr:LysR family transcriptional regulator [Ancylobacter sp. Lp-2]MCB4771458.1 LysR family transcriptional regulator [Ancylobacter sp. Lp-2]